MTAVRTISAVSTSLNELTITAHGLNTGDGWLRVFGASPGAVIPGGLAAITDYWAIKVDANTIKLATSSANALAGTAIGITSTGSGTLELLQGLPYAVPRLAAPGVQVFSADDNDDWNAMVAVWNYLSGQSLSIFGAARGIPLPIMGFQFNGSFDGASTSIGFGYGGAATSGNPRYLEISQTGTSGSSAICGDASTTIWLPRGASITDISFTAQYTPAAGTMAFGIREVTEGGVAAILAEFATSSTYNVSAPSSASLAAVKTSGSLPLSLSQLQAYEVYFQVRTTPASSFLAKLYGATIQVSA